MKGKFFKFVKWVTIIAMVCTIVLTSVEIYSCTLDAEESKNMLAGIQAIAQKLFKPEEGLVVPQKIEIEQWKLNRNYYFSGDKVKLDFTSFPKDADKEVTYEFEFEYGGGDNELAKCSVDEEGYFCYTGTHDAKINVTATSVHAPGVQCEFYLYYRGINPASESVERMSMDFYYGGTRCEPTELEVGKTYLIYPTLYMKDEYLESYGLTERAVKSSGLIYEFFFENGEGNELYRLGSWRGEITFLRPYEGNMKVKFPKGENVDFAEEDACVCADYPISLRVEEPDYPYVPTKALVPVEGEYDAEAGEYVVNVPYETKIIKLKSESQGKNINTSFYLCHLDEKGKEVAKIDRLNQITRKVNRGVCYLEMVSVFDETLRTKVKINFQGYTPEKLNVYVDKELALYSSIVCAAGFEKNLYNENEVIWTLLEGADKVKLVDNILTANHLGKVVLRAQSVAYPELYEDVEIEIWMWTSFELFVRKAVGHFLVFAFLGLGYFVCYFFLIKKRKWAFILTPVSIVVLAAVTEYIQGSTPGRVMSAYDVLINSCGGLLGMLVGVAILLLLLLLLGVFSSSVRETYAHISAKSMFTRNKK